jgi:hypothetical protein
MAFLEIVTRTFGQRPKMLLANKASVDSLRGADAFQVFVVDNGHAGVAAANARLATYTPLGQYVLVLDDDDVLIYDKLVEDLKHLAWLHGNPPAFIVRMDHGSWIGVQPDLEHWCQPPVEGHIGCSAMIVRRDVWMEHRQAWASGRYASDFDFIAAVWRAYGPQVVWHDVIATKCQRISHGEPEPAGRVKA